MRTVLTALIIALLLPLAHADLVTKGSGLDATLLYYEPVPAQPGDQLDVWIQLENDGGSPTGTGSVTILDAHPFLVESESERVNEFPAIPALENFLIKTKVRVANDATIGTNLLRVRIDTASGVHIEREFEIEVTGRTTALTVVRAGTLPSEVLPGQEALLEVQVQNIGETTLRNVDVALDLEDLNLAPVDGSASESLARLTPGAMHTYRFTLAVYPDTEPRAYRIPMSISYDDGTSDTLTQSETIGIVVGAKPELLLAFERVDLTQSVRDAPVVLQIVNKGLSEVKLVELEIAQSDAVQVTSESPILYIGNIDADDYESADVTLRVDGDEVEIPVTLRYKDALNRPYEEQRTLILHVKPDASGGGMSWGWIVLVIVVVGIGIWVWRRRSK